MKTIDDFDTQIHPEELPECDVWNETTFGQTEGFAVNINDG